MAPASSPRVRLGLAVRTAHQEVRTFAVRTRIFILPLRKDRAFAARIAPAAKKNLMPPPRAHGARSCPKKLRRLFHLSKAKMFQRNKRHFNRLPLLRRLSCAISYGDWRA